jgi:hypothetical protein
MTPLGDFLPQRATYPIDDSEYDRPQRFVHDDDFAPIDNTELDNLAADIPAE